MKILNLKMVLTLSLLIFITTNSFAHSEKVLCRIKEEPCISDGAFVPGTNQYNPNLSMGLFLVITNIEVAQSFEYVGKRKYINPENKNWGVASCELIGNSRSKALAEARQLAAELKSAGICDYVLEVKPTGIIK